MTNTSETPCHSYKFYPLSIQDVLEAEINLYQVLPRQWKSRLQPGVQFFQTLDSLIWKSEIIISIDRSLVCQFRFEKEKTLQSLSSSKRIGIRVMADLWWSLGMLCNISDHRHGRHCPWMYRQHPTEIVLKMSAPLMNLSAIEICTLWRQNYAHFSVRH